MRGWFGGFGWLGVFFFFKCCVVVVRRRRRGEGEGIIRTAVYHAVRVHERECTRELLCEGTDIAFCEVSSGIDDEVEKGPGCILITLSGLAFCPEPRAHLAVGCWPLLWRFRVTARRTCRPYQIITSHRAPSLLLIDHHIHNLREHMALIEVRFNLHGWAGVASDYSEHRSSQTIAWGIKVPSLSPLRQSYPLPY